MDVSCVGEPAYGFNSYDALRFVSYAQRHYAEFTVRHSNGERRIRVAIGRYAAEEIITEALRGDDAALIYLRRATGEVTLVLCGNP